MNIYVGNLPFTTSEEDLKGIFEGFGAVESAKIIMDRETSRSRGFGFIEMGEDDAKKAIEELNGTEFQGNTLTVNEARPKKPMNRDFNRGGGGFQKRW
jgi:RNA recognition motif-containing protein